MIGDVCGPTIKVDNAYDVIDKITIPYIVQGKYNIKKKLSKRRLKIRAFRYYC